MLPIKILVYINAICNVSTSEQIATIDSLLRPFFKLNLLATVIITKNNNIIYNQEYLPL